MERRPSEVVSELVEKSDATILLEPPRTEVAAEGPSLGPDDAAVTIVEFSDFQCPFCRRSGPVVKQLLETYPSDVRVVYRHMPLGFHDRARHAAVASVCADRQDRFWDYHDLLFEAGRGLSDEELRSYAAELGLDTDAFESCLSDPAAAAVVDADLDAARLAQITGTPAFFVNGILLSGARPFEDFQVLIEAELARGNP